MNIRVRDHRGTPFKIPSRELADYINAAAFVAFYDAADIKVDNRMHPLDWAVSTLLQAPIRRYSPFVDLHMEDAAQWRACENSLRLLGKDIPLESEQAPARCAAVESCFKEFMTPAGIAVAIAAKTLHKKRPQLIPVVDDYVSRFFAGRPGSSLGWAGATRLIFDEFRPQLLANIEAIDEVALALDGFKLSRCRILDIAIWRHVHSSSRDYGVRR